MKKKYFVNGFPFIAGSLKKYDSEFTFDFVFPTPNRFDFVTNYLLIKKLIRQRKLEKYDVVHLGTWEGVLAYKKRNPRQIFIAHAHGFSPGLNYDQTIVELPFVKRQLAKVLKLLVNKKMQNQIVNADIFYVSTPNMLEHAKKLRKDAIWLPNPIDTGVFNENGSKIKLKGNLVVFLPTRLHAFKDPLYGVEIFNEIKRKYPDARLHIVNYGRGADPLYNEFMFRIIDKNTVVKHNRMPIQELAKYYRSADLVLGQFNPKLGNLSLVELEAMACGAPLVTLDKYEINTPLNVLKKLAFKLIEDKKYKKKYVEKNLDFIKKTHSFEASAEIQKKNLKRCKDDLF